MSNLAEKFEEIFVVENDYFGELECDVIELDSAHSEPVPANFFEEIDAWARHSAGLNGFGDY